MVQPEFSNFFIECALAADHLPAGERPTVREVLPVLGALVGLVGRPETARRAGVRDQKTLKKVRVRKRS